MDDISKLYNLDLKDFLIAAVNDTEVIKLLTSGKIEELKYFNDYMGLKNSMNYFQSGFLIFNLLEVKLFDLTKHCLAVLKRINAPKFVDQDILNVVVENKVKFLEQKWNVESHIVVNNKNLVKILPKEELSKYLKALKKQLSCIIALRKNLGNFLILKMRYYGGI